MRERIDAYAAAHPETTASGNRPNRGKVIERAITEFLNGQDKAEK